jgi:hypothetical protein
LDAGASVYSAKPPGEWMPTGPAKRARPVGGERVHGHEAAEEAFVDALPHLRDGAGELVAHHEGRGTVAHLAQVALYLGAADPGRRRSDDHGPRLDGRLRHLVDRHLLGPVPDYPLHAFHLLGSERPWLLYVRHRRAAISAAPARRPLRASRNRPLSLAATLETGRTAAKGPGCSGSPLRRPRCRAARSGPGSP